MRTNLSPRVSLFSNFTTIGAFGSIANCFDGQQGFSLRRRPAGGFALRIEYKNRRRDAGATNHALPLRIKAKS
jgi:hypothetical protein